MENQITFFVFKDVRKSYSENLHQIRPMIVQKKRKLEEKNKELNKILSKNRKLNKEEKEELDSYNLDVKLIQEGSFQFFREFIESNRYFGAYMSVIVSVPKIEEIQEQIKLFAHAEDAMKRTYLKLDCEYELKNHISESDVENLKESFFEKSFSDLEKKYDLSKIMEMKSHEPFLSKIQVLAKEIEENEKFIAEHENKERIDTKDIASLNHEIKKMNKNGWVVKQMEGIQSGKAGGRHDGGYGYSFTEGILILWEREV